jgi:hypothetical protein
MCSAYLRDVRITRSRRPLRSKKKFVYLAYNRKEPTRTHCGVHTPLGILKFKESIHQRKVELHEATPPKDGEGYYKSCDSGARSFLESNCSSTGKPYFAVMLLKTE